MSLSAVGLYSRSSLSLSLSCSVGALRTPLVFASLPHDSNNKYRKPTAEEHTFFKYIFLVLIFEKCF